MPEAKVPAASPVPYPRGPSLAYRLSARRDAPTTSRSASRVYTTERVSRPAGSGTQSGQIKIGGDPASERPELSTPVEICAVCASGGSAIEVDRDAVGFSRDPVGQVQPSDQSGDEIPKIAIPVSIHSVLNDPLHPRPTRALVSTNLHLCMFQRGKEAHMAWDFTVELENQPGALADLGETTGKAGVNLEAVCGITYEDVGVIHILVDDADAARNALTEGDISIRDEREVLVTDVTDRPGALGELTRRLADADINIDLIYLATNTRIVLGVDKLDKARGLL